MMYVVDRKLNDYSSVTENQFKLSTDHCVLRRALGRFMCMVGRAPSWSSSLDETF